MGSAAKHVLHEALLWGAMALAGFALFYFFDDLKAAFTPDSSQAPAVAEQSAPEPATAGGFGGEVRLKADSRGHFQVPAEVNGRPADFTADTGATLVVLTYEDAARLGLSPQSLDFSGLADRKRYRPRGAAHPGPRAGGGHYRSRRRSRGGGKRRACHQSAWHELLEPAEKFSDAG